MDPVARTEGLKEALEPESISFFYHATPGCYSHFWEQSSIYNRIEPSTILGQPPDSSEDETNAIQQQDISRCFNCGDCDHKVTTCPFPVNRELVALSRQYYQFFHGGSGPQWQRLHIFESHRQRRLDWLEEFTPGDIRGDVLLDALADSDDQWLRNICDWGYPPGWMSDVDPYQHIQARIWDDYDCDDVLFEIHGEDGVEAVSIRADMESHSENAHSDQDDDLKNGAGGAAIRRWAKYPNRYFSSGLLFPYTRKEPNIHPSWSDTSFVSTSAYLDQHLWPPPPPDSPPPLPPSAIQSLKPHHFVSQDTIAAPESDMEMSDSE